MSNQLVVYILVHDTDNGTDVDAYLSEEERQREFIKRLRYWAREDMEVDPDNYTEEQLIELFNEHGEDQWFRLDNAIFPADKVLALLDDAV